MSSPSDLDLLTRFICTGSEEGCFNYQEKPEFKEKTPCLSNFLTKDTGTVAVKRIKRVYAHRRFVKKDPLLYSLARLIRNTPSDAHEEDKVRQDAYLLAETICDTSEDLFAFVHFNKMVSGSQKAGWGGGMRRFLHRWYEKQEPCTLASHVTRCKSSRGWRHRDLIRQCHIPPERHSKGLSLIINYIISGKKEIAKYEASSDDGDVKEVMTFLKAVEQLKGSRPEEKEIMRSLIETHRLCDKQIPTNLYNCPETYEGILGHATLEKLFRYMEKMAKLKMLDADAAQIGRVLDRLRDVQAIKHERVPPLVILSALQKYQANRNSKWVKNPQVVEALKTAFDVSQTLLPKLANCKVLVAVHLQADGKKTFRVKGAPYLMPIKATGHLIQFMHQSNASVTHIFFNERSRELPITGRTQMAQIIEALNDCRVEDPNFDLTEPIKWARQKKGQFESILIITDMKKVANAAEFHDHVRLYREESSLPNCKVAVVGLNDLTTAVANRSDLNLLEVSGLHETVPSLLLNFFRGDLDFEGSDDSDANNIGTWDSSAQAGASAH